ncbi:nucleotidyltransferase family protein [Kamptonema formosum]|uniref:nucleotidyltransferase family protein n=1 Tax=Kamptonema formosum TaxID=331992 RepID=UPI00035F0A3E|nr:nucleotidyltransferase family protein [Oscillatoria sp. PCC 10802]
MKDRLSEIHEQKESHLPHVGLVLLAAGASTRMGTPKQLLLYQGRSLLRHSAEVAVASKCRPVAVVLGASAGLLRNEVRHLSVRVVENEQWAEGISSSIRRGIEALNAGPTELEAVVIMLCDQPFVSAESINKLVDTYSLSGQPIVASEYAGTLGVPALFSRRLFSELASLSGDRGAKDIIRNYSQYVACIPFSEGATDIDTLEDFERLCEINV